MPPKIPSTVAHPVQGEPLCLSLVILIELLCVFKAKKRDVRNNCCFEDLIWIMFLTPGPRLQKKTQKFFIFFLEPARYRNKLYCCVVKR